MKRPRVALPLILFSAGSCSTIAGTHEATIAAGYEVVLAHEIELARQLADLYLPVAVVASVDAVSQCLLPSLIRVVGEAPVLAIVPRGAAALAESVIAMGAVDVAFQPVSRREMAARLNSIIRRAHMTGVVRDTRSKGLSFTRSEKKVLIHLARNAGSPIANTELVDRFLPGRSDGAFRLFMSRLRKKVALKGLSVTIHTVRGAGYLLEFQDSFRYRETERLVA